MTRTLQTVIGPTPRSAAKSNDTDRLLHAASIALANFPGAVGQLLHREILTHMQLRHRFADARALVPRIVADLLDEPVVDEPVVDARPESAPRTGAVSATCDAPVPRWSTPPAGACYPFEL
jgi:hypothetical protein